MRKILILIFLLLCLSERAFAYQVCFEGVAAEEIRELISSISQLQTKQDRPPPTLFTLKKRAEKDKKAILSALHSFGFYEPDVSISYTGEFPHTTVLLQITSGPQYLFSDLSLVDSQGVPWWVRERCLNLQIGLPARADLILDTEEQILEELGGCGYPLACVAERKVVVDQACKGVSVTYVIEPGPLAYFRSFFY